MAIQSSDEIVNKLRRATDNARKMKELAQEGQAAAAVQPVTTPSGGPLGQGSTSGVTKPPG